MRDKKCMIDGLYNSIYADNNTSDWWIAIQVISWAAHMAYDIDPSYYWIYNVDVESELLGGRIPSF